MLLAIDAGNTNTVFALFDGHEKKGVWRTVTNARRTSDDYAVFLRTLMQEAGLDPVQVTDAIIGSVVPTTNFHLCKLCRDHFNCEPLLIGMPDIKLGIKVKLKNPQEVGADRLINVVAALETYKPLLLLIDFGTATTFDVVDAAGAHCGGAIAPGADLSLQALHTAAAKLPRVAIQKPQHVIGTGTIEAIQSGVFWGYVGLVEGLITRIQEECGLALTVIATGGLSALFRDAIPAMQYTDPDLTLRGLQLIYQRNRK